MIDSNAGAAATSMLFIHWLLQALHSDVTFV